MPRSRVVSPGNIQPLALNRLYGVGLWSWATVRSCIAISIVEIEVISISRINDFLSCPKDLFGRFYYGLQEFYRPEVSPQPRLQILGSPTLFMQKDRDSCQEKLERLSIKDIFGVLDLNPALNTSIVSEFPIYNGYAKIPWDHITTLDYVYGNGVSKDLLVDSLLGYSSILKSENDFYSRANELLIDRVRKIATPVAESKLGNMSQEVCRVLIDAGVLNNKHIAGLRLSQRDDMLATDLGL